MDKRNVKSTVLLSNSLLLVTLDAYLLWGVIIYTNLIVIVIGALLWSVTIYHI